MVCNNQQPASKPKSSEPNQPTSSTKMWTSETNHSTPNLQSVKFNFHHLSHGIQVNIHIPIALFDALNSVHSVRTKHPFLISTQTRSISFPDSFSHMWNIPSYFPIIFFFVWNFNLRRIFVVNDIILIQNYCIFDVSFNFTGLTTKIIHLMRNFREIFQDFIQLRFLSN